MHGAGLQKNCLFLSGLNLGRIEKMLYLLIFLWKRVSMCEIIYTVSGMMDRALLVVPYLQPLSAPLPPVLPPFFPPSLALFWD